MRPIDVGDYMSCDPANDAPTQAQIDDLEAQVCKLQDLLDQALADAADMDDKLSTIGHAFIAGGYSYEYAGISEAPNVDQMVEILKKLFAKVSLLAKVQR